MAPAPTPDRSDDPPPPAPSFRALFEAHSSYVWVTLQRLGVHERDLEDIAHEVFMTVHRHIADYDPARPLKPWLFGIALRTAMRYRDLARHRREVMDGDIEAVDQRPLVDEQLRALDDRRLVSDALAMLDDDQRAVFILHEIDEVAIPDAARELSIPMNTAYSRLRRARARFREVVTRLRLRRGES